MRTAFAAHAVPPSPRTMASAPAVPRIISRRVRQRPDARSENQIAATMQAAPSAGPTMTRPVRNRSNSVPNQAKVGAGHVAEKRPADAEGDQSQERDGYQ